MYSKHKHLIIGGGFGGLRVAKLLYHLKQILNIMDLCIVVQMVILHWRR